MASSTRPLMDESSSGATSDEEISASKRFTRRQLTFIIPYGLFNVFRGVYILIVGPFFPPEAAGRGISTSTTGMIIGSFNFSMFFAILLYGKYFIPKFGPRCVIISSAIITTTCATLFGCMGFIKDRTTFLVVSFALRIIGGIGDAGFYPAAFAVFAAEFPLLVSTTISLFEIFFGIGAIFGPIACGPIIDRIGFEYTYIALGACLLVCSLLIISVTPEPTSGRNGEGSTISSRSTDSIMENGCGYGYVQLLKIPAVQFAIFCLFSTGASIGFITGTLQVHLEQFHLTSLQVGSIFSVTTGIYTVCSLAWGQISDQLPWNKILIISSGTLMIAAGFIMLGPLSFLIGKQYLWAVLAGLCLHGVGIGSSIIVSFAFASKSALKRGFPDTTSSSGLISSSLQLPFSLGLAVGPAVASALYVAVGFQLATLSVIGLCCAIILSAAILVIVERREMQDRLLITA